MATASVPTWRPEPMHFTGREHHSVDAKGRVSMPLRFRDVIFQSATAATASQLMLVPWFGECIRIFPVSCWEARMRVLEETLTEIDSFGYGEDESDLRRLIYGMAIEAQMDGHGRIVLAQHLRDEATIARDVYWVGLGDFLELWDPARLHERLSGENARRLRARLADLRRRRSSESGAPGADPAVPGSSPAG